MKDRELVDRSVRIIFRDHPRALFRLARMTVETAHVRPEDGSVIVPEYQADNVFLIETGDAKGAFAVYVEAMLQPDQRAIDGWLWKRAGLQQTLKKDVLLLVVYLSRGKYRTFPDRHVVTRGGITNRHEFATVRLWEHTERIRSGELPELAPLLVLCEDKPKPEILEEERRLILSAEIPPETQLELLGLAMTLGRREFAKSLLTQVFEKELPMLREMPFVEDWIQEAAEAGEQRGERRGAREQLLKLMQMRFGELPVSARDRVLHAGVEELEEISRRFLNANCLADVQL